MTHKTSVTKQPHKPDTAFWRAVETLLGRIATEVLAGVKHPISALIAGGVAVHYYTESRVSDDIDLEFSHRILLPHTFSTFFVHGDEERHIAIDTNYSTALGLMHPDYKEDAVYIETIGDVIRVNVLSALDLAVSKTARFQDNDKSDILALAQMGLLSESEFVARVNEALKYYVGNTDFIKYNIDDVVNMVESCRTQTPG